MKFLKIFIISGILFNPPNLSAMHHSDLDTYFDQAEEQSNKEHHNNTEEIILPNGEMILKYHINNGIMYIETSSNKIEGNYQDGWRTKKLGDRTSTNTRFYKIEKEDLIRALNDFNHLVLRTEYPYCPSYCMATTLITSALAIFLAITAYYC